MSHAEHLAAGNFLIPNATFIVELLLFVIIFGVLARVVLPRVQGTLHDRRKMLDKQIEDTDEARKQLVAAEQAYRSALDEARGEAARIREDARAEAQQTVERARTQAQQESARIVARGEEQLQSQRAAIVRDLRAEVGTLAVELSEKIVGEPLAEDPEVTATVGSFLGGLAAEDHVRTGADT
jgi:F-type H+-transporting ATPase subunit b